ncbi:hypothetical protein P8452_51652 [Trifolium repens]|nr:hypothetical protein P8452_51652 [Trifolium repens]
MAKNRRKWFRGLLAAANFGRAFGLKGSDKTEIIMLRLLKDKEVQWDGNALKNMENLKVLKLVILDLSGGFITFGNQMILKFKHLTEIMLSK